MRYGVSVPPFGPFGDASELASLAADAEAAGWDGFFVWDHIVFDPSFHPIVDPWVGLAAVALNTTTLRIGTLVTPVARRRPWKLARETVSVDRLSGGRLILGVGLGDPAQWDYGFFGEATDARERATKLDEGLAVLAGLWTGEPFSWNGEHYHLDEVTFRPPPAQQPRIPIWVGGWWPNRPPMRRAARWDGMCPIQAGEVMSPWDIAEAASYVAQHRTVSGPLSGTAPRLSCETHPVADPRAEHDHKPTGYCNKSIISVMDQRRALSCGSLSKWCVVVSAMSSASPRSLNCRPA